MTKCEKCWKERKVEPYYDEGFQEYFNLCKSCRKKQGEKNDSFILVNKKPHCKAHTEFVSLCAHCQEVGEN